MKSKNCVHRIKNNAGQTTFIIMCAKKSNLRGYKNIPLMPITQSQLLIDIQIKTIKKQYNDSEIIIVSGFEHDKLINHIHSKKYKNVRVLENTNYKFSNIIDGWRMSLNMSIKNNTFIIHGDRQFSCEAIHSNNYTYLVTNGFDKKNYNLGVLYSQDALINMSYGLPNIWSEIFFLHSRDFHIARNLLNECHLKKVYNIESYINLLSNKIPIRVMEQKPEDVKILKEIL